MDAGLGFGSWTKSGLDVHVSDSIDNLEEPSAFRFKSRFTDTPSVKTISLHKDKASTAKDKASILSLKDQVGKRTSTSGPSELKELGKRLSRLSNMIFSTISSPSISEEDGAADQQDEASDIFASESVEEVEDDGTLFGAVSSSPSKASVCRDPSVPDFDERAKDSGAAKGHGGASEREEAEREEADDAKSQGQVGVPEGSVLIPQEQLQSLEDEIARLREVVAAHAAEACVNEAQGKQTAGKMHEMAEELAAIREEKQRLQERLEEEERQHSNTRLQFDEDHKQWEWERAQLLLREREHAWEDEQRRHAEAEREREEEEAGCKHGQRQLKPPFWLREYVQGLMEAIDADRKSVV